MTGGRIARRIAALDPVRDNEEVAHLSVEVRYGEAFFVHAAYLVAFTRQVAVPSIARIVYRTGTGDLMKDVRRRNDHTLVFFGEMLRHGRSSERGRAAIDRMEQIHSRGRALVDQLFADWRERWFPGPLRPLADPVLLALLDEPLRAAHRLPGPSPAVQRVVPSVVRGYLALHGARPHRPSRSWADHFSHGAAVPAGLSSYGHQEATPRSAAPGSRPAAP